MKLSIVFLTCRMEPRLDWLLEAVVAQAVTGDEIEIIAIDALHGSRPIIESADFARITRRRAASCLIHIRETSPKPTIWQGEHRITRDNWWAAASGRNTGLVLASHPYVAFIDDRCRPGPKWLDEVRRGMREQASVLAGSYDKLVGPANARTLDKDHRREHSPNGLINCGGGWLFGCTLALPLEWALEVNGFEEGCDSLTGEDYLFGLMLGNAGRRIDFVPDLYVLQDRQVGDHAKNWGKTLDKGVPGPDDKSHAALERFGSRKRTEFTPDLRVLRQCIALGAGFSIPDPDGSYIDWYDASDIREM